jgi:HAD superfamily hydrolase (TIGR01549 family)
MSQPPPRQPPPASGEPLDAQPTQEESGGAVAAILDIDGTLVDTNYQHTIAWGRAFADHGLDVALWRIHRHNGMGGDQLVAAVAGDEVEERLGDAIRDSESDRYAELIDEVRPLPGGRDLLTALRRIGCPVVLASSAKEGEVERYVDLLDAREIVDAWTTGADVERTKPHPDLIAAAAERLPDSPAVVVIGDTAWDAVAADRAGFASIGVLSGGFGAQELRDAGCIEVFEDAADLAEHLESALEAVRSAGAAVSGG